MKPIIEWKRGDVAIIRPSWYIEGLELKVLGPALECGGYWWVPVEDEGEPTFYKSDHLEIKSMVKETL